ncbi:MAG: esterase family protein [Dysgonamonadaceae bacterium]|jgi:S-formylglutathione hydrolase FrmB|nr:esterase family protein [Dysgonamonadaceae bacterium]
MKRLNLVYLFLICIPANIFAAKVDTVKTYSRAMQKEIPAIVVTPENYSANKQYPTVYLLHGYSGDYTGWMNINGDCIKKMADTREMIIISPDGGFSSWYFDHPADRSWQYETYISSELIEWIDSHYSTIQSPDNRGITGLSMGGHGALFLAFRHQDVFGIAGSMSGGVDIRPFPLNWDLSKRLGNYSKNPENWEKNTVINLVHLLTPNSLKIIIDCGTDDFFYQVNVNLHNKLIERNIPHNFISRPGKHNSEYWSNAIHYQLLFMALHFEKQ